MRLGNLKRGEIAGDAGGVEMAAGEEEHHIGGEIDPPVGRLDFGDGGSIGRW